MHFVKTIVSLFALSSFAAANIYESDDSDLVARDVAYVDYLAARHEFIGKRDLYLRAVSPPHA